MNRIINVCKKVYPSQNISPFYNKHIIQKRYTQSSSSWANFCDGMDWIGNLMVTGTIITFIGAIPIIYLVNYQVAKENEEEKKKKRLKEELEKETLN